jgi:proteasome assembly chaperone (PAC2) family protein
MRLSLMIGEAQPMSHGLEYCRRILDRAQKLGVTQVITFAAVAADSHPRDPSRVLGVATQVEGLDSLRRHGIETLEAGQIMGMNGLFLAAAAERGISGLCLMGVMPALAASIPYPKASYAVLSAFSRLVEVDLDLEELEEYGQIISQKLTTGLDKLKEVLQGSPDESGEPEFEPDGDEPGDDAPSFGPEERRRIEAMFDQAALDPAKAFELKRELDRLHVFKSYENRFLDLFRSHS